MRKMTNGFGRALGAAVMAASLGLGACSDFLEGAGDDPNSLPSADAGQLFTSVQVNTFFVNESQITRLSAMWLNQMAGAAQQFTASDQYQFGEDELDGEFGTLYTGGGLIDIRRGMAAADSLSYDRLSAIFKIHEAFLFGMAASIWGDIPYSQAASGDPEFDAELDDQAVVYDAMQDLLDQAISQLGQPAEGAEPGLLSSRDMNFKGNAAQWIAAANSLKARYYLHWVEAQTRGNATDIARANTACGGNCITKGIAAAQAGISTSTGNWRGIHSSTSTERNIWYQFVTDRPGYIVSGALLVGLLNGGTPSAASTADDDPRLAIYFSPHATNGYIGSPPGTGGPNEFGTNSAQLNVSGTGYAAPERALPIITCAETKLILAELYYYQGNEAAANQALDEGIACHGTQLGVDLTAQTPGDLSGAALLNEILEQKYIVTFLNMEAFNDFKRTCWGIQAAKAGTSVQNRAIPRRPYYAQTERQENPNIPTPEEQDARRANDNDPINECSGARNFTG